MNNRDELSTLNTQDTRQRQAKYKQQTNTQHNTEK